MRFVVVRIAVGASVALALYLLLDAVQTHRHVWAGVAGLAGVLVGRAAAVWDQHRDGTSPVASRPP